MVYRIYVEKKPGFDVEANGLKNELTSLLGIKDLTGLRLLNRYDVEGIDEALFDQCVSTVFSEPPVDNTYAELPASEGVSFAVEYLPGQFDQRAASAAECIQLISQGERPLVRSARVYLLEGALTPEQVTEIKKYVINPVEAREASLETKDTLKMDYPVPAAVAVLERASTSWTRQVLPSSSRKRVWPWIWGTSSSVRSTSAPSSATPPLPRSR